MIITRKSDKLCTGSYDSYYPHADRIYRVTNHITFAGGNDWVIEYSPLPMADMVQKEFPGVEAAARLMNGGRPVLNINNQLFVEKKAAYIDSGWLRIFPAEFLEGDKVSFLKNPYSVLLTASNARKYFGSKKALGQIVRIDTINYQVRGIIQDYPTNSSFPFDFLMPLAARLSDPEKLRRDNAWNNANYITFLRLSPQANPAQAAGKLTAALPKYRKGVNVTITLEPLRDMHFETGIQSLLIPHTDRKAIYIFSVLAALLLITACINYVNLTTARASHRAKEVGVRKIVGAGRIQLFLQFVTESLLISFFSLVLTLLLAEASLPFLNRLTEQHFTLPLDSHPLWTILGWTLLVATLLNGIYPALLLSSFRPLNVFRGINALGIKDGLFRKSLVVLQFTIALALMLGTVVIFCQMQYIQQSTAGYDRSQILRVNLPTGVFARYKYDFNRITDLEELIKNELRANTAIQDLALADQSIISVGNSSSGGFDWEGRDKDFNIPFARFSMDADFPRLFGLQLKEGRWLDPNNMDDRHNTILNETALEECHIQEPVIGQRFIRSGDTGHIVGVVKDFHYKSLHEKIGPLVIYAEREWGMFFIRTYPNRIPQAIKAVEKTWNKFIPLDPLEYSFMDGEFDHLYKADQKVSKLILVFSIIAILISALGLFALAAFMAEQRTREIGIRKVLGASLSGIVILIAKDFVKLILLAILISSPIAWWLMNKWLQDFAYPIAIEGWMFALAGGLAMTVALLPVGFHAFKAAAANPVESLRTE